MDTDGLSHIYDKFAESYDRNRDTFNIDKIIRKFLKQTKINVGTLLDLGCGAGVPLGKSFIENGWCVTGVDFSPKMLSLANKHVPEMKTVCSDICSVEFSECEFDAISLIYSMFHIPKEQHEELFNKLYRWIKPNGTVLFTYATKEYTGSEEFSGFKEFLGQQLFYSHETPDKLFQQIRSVGFDIICKDYHCISDETFLWLTLRKPA